MAPSRVSGLRTENLLFGVILGLLAVVHSTPVNTVTQIPSEAEDDFFREAMTDGFLIDQSLPTLLTTESLPKKPTGDSSSSSSTTQIPQSGVTASAVANETQAEESNSLDGSGDEDHTTTTQSVSHVQGATSTVLPRDTVSDSSTTQIPPFGFLSTIAGNEAHSTESNDFDGSGVEPASIATTTQSVSRGQSSTSTVLEMDTEDSSSDPSTTQIPQSDFTSPFMLNEAPSIDIDAFYGSGQMATTESVSHVQSSTSKVLPRNFVVDLPEGSGETMTTTATTTTTMTTTTTTTLENMIEPVITGSTNKGRLLANGDAKNLSERSTPADGTPSWIIIVGFIVGVAALVMLCVAIATRDKWNGPSRSSQLETNTNSSNQPKEVEMETFLHKDNPRENGKAAEYTVIPLDELSESYSAH